MCPPEVDATNDILIATVAKQVVQIERGWLTLTDRMNCIDGRSFEFCDEFFVQTLRISQLLEHRRVIEVHFIFVLLTTTNQVKLSLFSNDLCFGPDDDLGKLGSLLRPITEKGPGRLCLIKIKATLCGVIPVTPWLYLGACVEKAHVCHLNLIQMLTHNLIDRHFRFFCADDREDRVLRYVSIGYLT